MPWIAKFKKNPKFHFVNTEKQIVPCECPVKEVSFKWSVWDFVQTHRLELHYMYRSS